MNKLEKEEFDSLAAITAPTEDWEHLTTQYFEAQKRKGRYIKLGFGIFIAIPFLSFAFVLFTR